MRQMDGPFTPSRKGINVSQLYINLLDIREHVLIDDDYQAIYNKILRNLSHTKRIRTYMSAEFDVKLSIANTQNLAYFVYLCHNFAIATGRKNFEYCLLPPPKFDYILWQMSIFAMQKARKEKRKVVCVEYNFRNDLNKSLSSSSKLQLPHIEKHVTTHPRRKHSHKNEHVDNNERDMSLDVEQPPNKKLTKEGQMRKDLAMNKKKKRISVDLVLPVLR